jgi:hypothetical protein
MEAARRFYCGPKGIYASADLRQCDRVMRSLRIVSSLLVTAWRFPTYYRRSAEPPSVAARRASTHCSRLPFGIVFHLR